MAFSLITNLAAAGPDIEPTQRLAALARFGKGRYGMGGPRTPSGDPVAAVLKYADVREELDRLKGHVGAARDLLDAGGPVGRRLDFLAQEFGREANTLCAKANHPSLTAQGLELRAEIEQMREQVQNIE